MGRISAVFKADGEETAGRYSISEWWLEPHTQGPGAHSHPEDDVFFVLEGTMSFLVAMSGSTPPPARSCWCPAASSTFENRGDAARRRAQRLGARRLRGAHAQNRGLVRRTSSGQRRCLKPGPRSFRSEPTVASKKAWSSGACPERSRAGRPGADFDAIHRLSGMVHRRALGNRPDDVGVLQRMAYDAGRPPFASRVGERSPRDSSRRSQLGVPPLPRDEWPDRSQLARGRGWRIPRREISTRAHSVTSSVRRRVRRTNGSRPATTSACRGRAVRPLMVRMLSAAATPAGPRRPTGFRKAINRNVR